MDTLNDFTPRADVQPTDDIVTKRGSAAGAESLTPWSVLLAAARAGVLCTRAVDMPADSDVAGAAGDYAISGDELALYIPGIGFRFITLHAK